MRQDIFDNLVAFEMSAKCLNLEMSPESKRYLERLIKLGRRNGMIYKQLILVRELVNIFKSIIKNDCV